ncbi:hypothetical protein [Coxiella burnetii]|uniref:Uncharacterized protein n=2 Tax=Coxiella burnetii TaxID=777 RepID=Q83B11_COXBU|nr:hypothetical protein [Coxiella burnetii]NP_820692.1 hypothetical protein CBU_1711 [Coxiella burnetii RSA 493]AAO91206.1 hypothetical protein CBU_1711 [Coxiella burnetii RSA 493]ABS77393.1 hypothetical protein CBUD_0295 [Coxiella burnetii Dugway 5J108-111]ABX78166.1 hypothetical protein COXBURSA331_A1898 [Coxiella burnetii RSA 331]ACJ17545.1 hypothetical protein CbuG_0090 [Coxiella burnetii CbuG_Q212]ACJ19609.1 hypothetical protein CbuK_0301 [Coxiella burnetii CbuK_Q154]
MRRYELTDEQFKKIEHILPERKQGNYFLEAMGFIYHTDVLIFKFISCFLVFTEYPFLTWLIT